MKEDHSGCTSQQSNSRVRRNECRGCERSNDTYDIERDDIEGKIQQEGVQRRVEMQRRNDGD